jgi:hypothetical protein
VPSDEVTAYHEEATSGDYGHLLRTTMVWVTCDADEETETYCGICGLDSDIYSDGMCEDCWDEAEDEEEN